MTVAPPSSPRYDVPMPPPIPPGAFYPPDPIQFPPLPDHSSLSKPAVRNPDGGLNYCW